MLDLFDALPAHELLPWEAALRSALLGAFDATQSPFPLSEWIEARIGGEIQARVADQSCEISLCGPEEESVRSVCEPEEDSVNQKADARNVVSDFFGALPDELTPEEADLGQAIIDFVEEWPSKRPTDRPGDAMPVVQDLMHDERISRCRDRALPPRIKLRTWIVRRLHNDVELRGLPGKGAHQVFLRAQNANEPTATRHCETSGLDDFFAQLPEDEFTEAEDALRNAVLEYLRGSKAPTGEVLLTTLNFFSSPGHRTELSRCKSEALPAGIALEAWIERRMGCEVEWTKDAKERRCLRMPHTGPGSLDQDATEESQVQKTCSQGGVGDRRALYVQGIPSTWRQQRIEDLFKRYGELHCVRLANIRKNGGLRSALVVFKRAMDADSACRMCNGVQMEEGVLLKCQLRAHAQGLVAAAAPAPAMRSHASSAAALAPPVRGSKPSAAAPAPPVRGHAPSAAAPAPPIRGHAPSAAAPAPTVRGCAPSTAAPAPLVRSHPYAPPMPPVCAPAALGVGVPAGAKRLVLTPAITTSRAAKRPSHMPEAQERPVRRRVFEGSA